MYVHFSSLSVHGDLAGFMVNLGDSTRHLMGAHHATCHAYARGAAGCRAGAHSAGIAASISRGFPGRHITAFVGRAFGFRDTDIGITGALRFGISGAAGRSSSLNPHFGFTLRLRRAGSRQRRMPARTSQWRKLRKPIAVSCEAWAQLSSPGWSR